MSEATPEKSDAPRATEACKQGLHGMCDGTGIDYPSGATVPCECLCHDMSEVRDRERADRRFREETGAR